MNDDDSIAGPQNQGSQTEHKLKRARRTQTSAEKAARQEKRLRDQYGDSPLDPSEPPLHGLSAAAIMCTIDLLRLAFRSGREFKPKTMTDKVAGICSLPEEQCALLLKWLVWAKRRRWVLQEAGRSAVVAWSGSRPDKTDVWTTAFDKQWRAQIEGAAASKEAEAAPKASSFPSSQPPETNRPSPPQLPKSGVALPLSEPVLAAPLAEPAPGGSLDKNDSTYRLAPPAHPAGQNLPTAGQPVERTRIAPVATQDVFDRGRITRLPYPAYKEGQVTANKFARAAGNFIDEKGSAEDLKTAARSLLQDASACREFCQRSSDHRKFVESIFKQLGWEVP